ncbi:DUF4190 domain-containing protein [Rothia sp. CCM 9416]|uniref:DUF4190 domain-containing protein n=1 Tax=Rothia sp. CCM 9416 TaxID=3402655 RepID=UPI003ADC373F
MTTGNNNNYNPYGQYGNSQGTNGADAELNQQATSQPATDYGQQASGGQTSSDSYGQAQANAQGDTGYGSSQPQYGNTSAANQQQPNYSAPGYGYSQYPAGGYPTYAAAETNKPKGLAIASMVLGIIGFISGWAVIGGIFALVAIVLGIVALVKTKTGGGGKGFAITGIVTGALGLLISILMLILFGWMFAAIGPAMENCSQYIDNETQLEQCLNEQLGLEFDYSSGEYQNS